MSILRQSSSYLLHAKPMIAGTSKQVRCFTSGARLMEEDAAAASQKLNADFAAALRRAIAGQQKGPKSEGGEQKGPRHEGGQQREARSQDGQQPASESRVRKSADFRGKRQTGGDRSATTNRRTRSRLFRKTGDVQPVDDGAPMARIQTQVKPITNWESGNKAAVPYTRVPYALPKVDLASLKENLTKQNTPKTWHPLKEANRLLSLKGTSNFTLVQGGRKDPTPVARSGISQGAEPVKLVGRNVGDNADEKTISIAKEAKEARIQAIRENVGGDYSRFDAKEFVVGKGELSNEVAQAVASNDDMAPTHKGYTAKNIRQILNQAGA
ncbi:uncharacterized protein FA14DRAFT_39565 [Meira miltonrushii]|uniref:Uncharacterized protein n=1 Tax=Meira miltonrushii TaxID=1280837 RepID=A0A316VC87_9BASI|nr:uncharacterized protein FA14DRAFT_39565 [Meira miltonrushii]PWN35277.1 hypothetical protein FA14DRAFT_39565 [Meira miltonrushii]